MKYKPHDKSPGISKNRYLFLFLSFFTALVCYNLYKYPVWKGVCIGDAAYYWYAGDAFIHDNTFSIYHYFDNWPYIGWNFTTFRGYLVPVITLGIRTAANILGVHHYLIYLFISSMIYAFAFSTLFPKLYELISNRKSTVAQDCILFMLFYIGWRGYFFYLLLDIYSLIASIAILYYVILSYRKRGLLTKTQYFIWGLLLSLDMQLRPNAILLVYLSLVFMAINIGNRHKDSNEHIDLQAITRYIAMIVPFIMGIVLIEIPQILIFFDSGAGFHLFPYDTGNGLVLNSVQLNIETITLYPYTIVDDSGIRVLNDFFGHVNPMTPENILQNFKFKSMFEVMSLWFQFPLEMMKNYIFKGFTGMDVRFSNPYPTWIGDITKSEVVFSMIFTYSVNYVAVYSLYDLIRKRKTNRHEWILFAFLLFQSLIQALLHVEWRYFLPGYFLSYFISAYYFPSVLKDMKTGKKSLARKHGEKRLAQNTGKNKLALNTEKKRLALNTRVKSLAFMGAYILFITISVIIGSTMTHALLALGVQ